jgi:CDP-diglyceride synthetase
VAWVVVVIYMLAIVAALRNLVAARRNGLPADFWGLLAVLLLLLGVNKQLDLQIWFIETGRDFAVAQGWYERRRLVQWIFVAVLLVAMVFSILRVRERWADLWHQYRLVCAGVCLLLVFVFLRAASFQHVDELVGVDVGTGRPTKVLEPAALLLIAWACDRWQWRFGHMLGRKP